MKVRQQRHKLWVTEECMYKSNFDPTEWIERKQNDKARKRGSPLKVSQTENRLSEPGSCSWSWVLAVLCIDQ